MNRKEWIEKAIEYIDQNHEIELKKNKLYIDGMNYTPKQLREAFITHCKPMGESDHDIISQHAMVINGLKNIYAKKLELVTEIPETEFNVTDFLPVIDVEKNERLMINNQTKQLSSMSYEAWFSFLDQDSKNTFKEVTRLAKFEYDPYDLSTLNLMPYEHLEVLRVNLYNPPPWRHKPCPENPKIPPKILKLLNHIFPIKDERTYVLDWLYYALVDRNETYLVLNGAKGVGKGVFSKLAAALVGEDNYSEAPDSLLEQNNRFNSVLDKKRVILIDEVSMDKEKHTKLKRYANKKLNIEKKGLDADKAIETYNSYIISNNDDSDMYLEHDDRRFSVPTLSRKRLLDTFTEEEVSELYAEFENPDSDLVLEFGYWLFNRGAKKYSKVDPLKGPRFYELVESSLHLWQRYLLECVLNSDVEYLAIANMRRAYSNKHKMSKFPQDNKKITDFLQNYLHLGVHSLGELVEYEGENCIKINPALLKNVVPLDDEEMI